MPKTPAAYGHARKPKVEIDNIKFMSPGEAERYLELMIRKESGENIEVFLQPKFELQPKFRKCCTLIYSPIFEDPGNTKVFKKGICPLCGKKMPITHAITYTADFKIIHGDGSIEIEDVKGSGGYLAPTFELRKKLFEYNYPDLTLTLLKRAGKVKVREALLAERERLK
jgi:hypothetical protein